MLEEIPSGIELKQVKWSSDPDKATGYDGFNIRYIKQMWTTIGDDLTQFIQVFFISRELLTSINTTWVSLVSKVQNPVK